VLTSGDVYELIPYLFNDSQSGIAYVSGPGTAGADAHGNSNFSVVANNLVNVLGVTNTSQLYTIATTTCSVLNFSGCFQNAISWAFFPTQDALNLVAQDGQQIKTRPPVGYVFSTIGALQALSATGTAAFTLTEDWPIMHYIFSPIITVLTTLVWLLFGFGLFHRARHLDI
jgi:uncharacterized protein YacL